MTAQGGLTRIVAASILMVALAGCSSIGKTFGIGKNPPNEFEVVSKAPLVVPPDYNLKPPRPGEPRPQDLTPTQQAINALFPGRTTLPQLGSNGEQALVNDLAQNRGRVSSDARSNVGDDETFVVEKGVLLRDILTAGERVWESEGATIDHVESEPLDVPNSP